MSAMISVGARVKGWTVTMPLGPYVVDVGDDGWRELLAEDAAGGCVTLRVPPDQDGVEAIRVEAELAKQHVHESLVQSIGLVEHDGWPVQVLEHVDGLTLVELVAAGTLAPTAACRVGRQVAMALVDLHERAPVVCHGSLGPDRVVVDGGGNARLVDVGVARPTSRPRFLSPERRRAWSKPSAADDLWALGLVLADAVLGEARVVDDRLALPSGVALPARLVDALSVLVAPEQARVKNAAAVVRIFTELELRLAHEPGAGGDGGAALRDAVHRARDLSRTMRVDVAQLEAPKTMAMDRGAIPMAELQRIAAIADEMAARQSERPAPVRQAEIQTERIARASVTRVPAAPVPVPVPVPAGPVADPDTVEVPAARATGTHADDLADDLADDELDSVRLGPRPGLVAAFALAFVAAVALGVWLG